MATYTPNYNLKKPGNDDFINIADINSNMDKLDTELKTTDTAVDTHIADTAIHLTSSQKTDLTDGNDSSAHYHATDRNRANHTGTQTASTISDFAAAVRGMVLTGLSTATNAVITATDTILSALGKLQAQITAMMAVKTATITTTWTGSSAPYTQTITVSGITANDKPIISPVYSTTLATALLEKEAWNLVGKIETAANSIIVTCFEDKPVTAVNIQIKGA